METTLKRQYDVPNRTAPVYDKPPFDKPRRIPVASLHTDTQYAVGAKEVVVRHILKEGWNQIAAGAIRVNLRPDGTYWVLDGRGRLEATKRLGLTHIWAEIYHFRTIQEEAYWSRRWNIRLIPLTALEKFRSALDFGNKDATQINTLARKHGFRITSSRLIDYSLSAVTTLEKIHGSYGPDALDGVLEIVSKSWEGEPESTTEDILKAILILFANYAEVLDEEDLIFRLKEHKAVWWRREAEAERGDYPLFVKLATRFLKAYNYYKHSGRGGKLLLFDLDEASKIL